MSQGVHLRKYGVETKIDFELYEVDGVDLRVDAVDAGSDCNIMKDEGAEATCTNDFVDEGMGYSITLSATEMQAARIVLYIIDSAVKVWLDKVIIIETYGHASAMHAFDLDTASVAQSADNETRLALIEADTNELQTDDYPTSIAAIPTVDEIWAKAMSDLAQGAPSVTASVLTAINYLYESWRNKTLTTATLITLMKDNGTTALVKSTISDDATTFTKAEFISGA